MLCFCGKGVMYVTREGFSQQKKVVEVEEGKVISCRVKYVCIPGWSCEC